MTVAATISQGKSMTYRLGCILLLSIILTGCDRITGCQQREVLRIKSPDQRVEAIVIERDCGATTSASKSVFLAPTGMKPSSDSPIFFADKIDGLDIQWQAPKVLVVEYTQARIHSFTSFWAVRELDNFEYEVRIVEREKK